MTLDSSALVAILFSEAGHLDLVDRILDADAVRVGAPTLAETTIVVSARWRKPALRSVEALVRELGVAVVSCGDAEWKVAATAYQRFGRGRHKAALNFGDCLAYATAAVAGDTLLYVGDDFALTDIRAA
jgi:ribonuclease VapC